MRPTLILAAITVSSPSVAQLLERNTQPSWQSSTEHVVRWNDSLWAFVGDVNYLSSPFSGVITTVIDTTGQLHWEIPMLDPVNEGIFSAALAPLSDSVLLIAGWTIGACDGGIQQGFIMAHGLGGDSLWHRSLSSLGFLDHLATPDSVIFASEDDRVLVLDQQGDSLDLVTLPFGDIRRFRTEDSVALASCDSGALVLDAGAAVILSRVFTTGVDDFIRHSDSTYACLTGAWLHLLDAMLATIDSVNYGSVGGSVSLHEDLTYLWVIGSDTARFYDPLLQPALVFSMGAPAGHQLIDAAVGTDVIMTAGRFIDGPITTAVQRSVGKHGETVDVPVDAALGAVSAENIVFSPGVTPGLYDVDLNLRVWVRNDGALDLNNVFLTVFTGSWACGPVGVINQTGPGLLPGDSVLAYISGIFLETASPDSQSVDVEFCVRATTPNDLMDRDTTNNFSCAFVTIPIGMMENVPTSVTVFPNPAADRLHLSLSPALRESGYKITDPLGREVLRGTLVKNSIDLSSLGDGSYHLSLRPAGASARFVILR